MNWKWFMTLNAVVYGLTINHKRLFWNKHFLAMCPASRPYAIPTHSKGDDNSWGDEHYWGDDKGS